MDESRTGPVAIGSLFVFLFFLLGFPSASFAEISVIVNGQPVEDGGTFYTPMGRKGSGNKIALFSKSDAQYGINNNGDGPVTIENVELVRDEGVKDEEFQLLDATLDRPPLELEEPASFTPDEQFSFVLRFYPVRSGERKATVRITYDGGETYEWTVVGTGRNDASFFSHGSRGFEKVLGTSKADEMPSAMVADENGNMFFSANVTMVVDKFNNDVVLGRINDDGSFGWSRIWSTNEDDRSRDPGQNAETGGSAESMAIDSRGNIYHAGKWDNGALVLKVDPESGEPLWEQYWMAGWPSYSGGSHSANDFAEAYSVDASGGNIYVAGTTQNAVMLLLLDPADGSIRWQKKLDLHDGYKDRGYAIKVDGNGNLYVAGSGNNNGFVAKLTLDGGEPAFQWARQVDLGTGGNVNSLDLDGEGNLYLACDRRGAKTFFSLIRMSPEGQREWGKTWEASNTDQNNINVVRVLGDHVYAGGRLGIPSFDSQFGDGALVKLDKDDGSEAWSTFYYNGKGPDEITEHRIKGIAKSGDSLHLYAQAYTGPKNWERFWGYWYNGIGGFVDFDPGVTPINVNPDDAFVDVEDGDAKDLSDKRQYVDAMEHFTFQNARDKVGDEGNDGDMMFWRLDTND